MTPARDICDLLVARTNDGRNAFAFVESLFTQIIARLRRDSRFASVSRFESELLLGNERSEAERQLFHEMRDRVHLDDAEDAVRCCLGEDE